MFKNLIFVVLFLTIVYGLNDLTINPAPHVKKAVSESHLHREKLASSLKKILDVGMNTIKSEKRGISDECLTNVQIYFNRTECNLDDVSESNIAGICSNCLSLYQDLIQTCAPTNEQDEALLFWEIICLKDGDHFCFFDFKALDDLQGEEDQVTAQQLTALCRPCFRKLFRVMLSRPQYFNEVQEAIWFFNLVCTRHNGKFCVLEVQEFFNQEECPEGDVECTRKFFNFVCGDACLTKILRKLLRILPSNESVEIKLFLEVLCIQNAKNEYCFLEAEGLFGLFDQQCPTFNVSGCNGAGCSGALDNLINGAGCCLRVFLNYIFFTDPQTYNGIWHQLNNTGCRTDFGPPCPLPGRFLIRKRVILSILWSWYQSHNTEARERIRKDIEETLGVEVTKVEVSQSSSGNVQVVWEGGNQNDDVAAELSKDWDSSFSTDIFFPQTSQLYVQDYPGSVIEITSNVDESIDQRTSNSIQLISSLALIIIAITAILF